ncbi:molecular chaperone GrpE [Arcticibacter pallidicorallinus]|uniref:Protein GrpE n=1 Tax=Arcticibacter pallidicorallinus TaxID=1259464 RepID=A0A2T0U4C3_9SPHI|nr:nucleotide exchange factor GrpE [Arcticibacter pallidicorallinus]PRY52698.1 molecular chaperone GrpE [Arcticibacter pallidicorallinus]
MNFSDMLKNKKKTTEEEKVASDNQTQSEMEQNVEQAEQPQAEQSAEAEAQEVEEVSAEEKLRAELKEANDKYLRLYAEFDNYKRRTNKERIELLQSAGKDVLLSLLPIADDFDRAIKYMNTSSDIEAVKEGIVLVSSKFKTTLTQKGVKEMESIGTSFDADLHEAITNIPAPSEDMKGKVIDEVEKGYFLNDKVIRFAKVVVGS